MGPPSPNIAEHIALHGSRLLQAQEDLWNTTWRSCGIFECVHLGKDFDTNLRSVQNYHWKKGQLFSKTEKLISGQTETTGISLINSED